MADSTTDANPFVQLLLNASAVPPPPGIVPNYVDPPSIGYAVLVVATISMILATIMLALRVFTKLYLIKAWNLEDCIASFSFSLST